MYVGISASFYFHMGISHLEVKELSRACVPVSLKIRWPTRAAMAGF